MAIKWKKYKMYGPKKPGKIKRCWWKCKEKMTTMRGLYIISLILSFFFLFSFMDMVSDGDYTSIAYFYIMGLMNIIFWVYLIKRIDKDTSAPFFMNWMKRVDCDLLILFYAALFIAAVVFLLTVYYQLCVPIYDWEGYYIGTYFDSSNFSIILVPMILVNNAFVMIIIQHLKNPELRKATFCKRMLHKLQNWVQEKNRSYQKKYQFEKKTSIETVVVSVLLVVIGLLSMICVVSWGFSRLFLCLLVLIAATIIFIWVHYHREFLSDVGILVKEIHEVSTGNPLKSSAIPEDSMIYEAGEDLTHVFENLSDSVQRQFQSEKMKIDLITNVSHDLKTPLTSIIGYIELLKRTELSDEARDYVDVLARKSEHLKNMIQDVFEISKATSGNMDMHLENVNICTLMLQTMGDMQDRIEASKRSIKRTMSAEPLYVISDGQKLYRVYQNLIENALKYSLDGSRIFVDAYAEGDKVVSVIKNTASYEMDFTEESITERFTRGDINRTTEGHGLGLAIVKSFVEACGGTFHIEIDGDLFKAIVKFQRYIPDESEEVTQELTELPEALNQALAGEEPAIENT